MCMPYLRQVSGRTRVHSTLISGGPSSSQQGRLTSARIAGSESDSQESSSCAPASVTSQTLAVRLRLLSELGGRLAN
jgi:hypothetical protein